MATRVKKVTVAAIRQAARDALFDGGPDAQDAALRDLLGDDVVDAAQKFRALRDRYDHPDGRFDSAGRWYPDDSNVCPKCADVRPPSRRWPYSYMKHCRTADHVALVAGVDPVLVKRAEKALDGTL